MSERVSEGGGLGGKVEVVTWNEPGMRSFMWHTR